MLLRAADFSQTGFCLHFYSCFLKNDKIGMFFGTIFLCDLGPFGEFLRCGDLKLRCVRFGETAWHDSCDLGLRCESALRSAAICVARCEIAKIVW